MNFNTHSAVEGKHAFLSPSTYSWINYDEQKLDARWVAATAARRGVSLHEFAHKAIELGIKQPRTKKTIPMYVNDGIGFKMACEQPLYYSDNCFGTPDTISFRKNFLRIHDLKTGITKASHKQLVVYAAIFCLEYNVSPYDIDVELRIYQSDEIRMEEPHPDTIFHVMDKIITLDHRIELLKEGTISVN